MSKIIGFVVTAGHMDIEWYQPLRSYRFWTVEALEQLKKIRGNRGDFVTYCLDGQYYPLKEYLDVVPEDREEMKDLVRRGLLTIGPFYTQFDEWLPSAESMIRNCLYGERLCKAFGGYMRAGYLPDNFGHPLQLPQILRGFDIDSLLFMRGMPEVEGGHDDEFCYTGIDGSKLFASHFRETYSGAFNLYTEPLIPTQPREVPYYPCYLSYERHLELATHKDPQLIARSLIENVHRIKDRYPTGIIPLISGGDHLPPQINVGDTVKAANEMQDEIEFVMGDAEQYVKLASERAGKNAPCQEYGMELLGSRYQHILMGSLSSRSYLKRENFACEALLEKYAEPLDAIASLFGYPRKQRLFDEAWENLMINSAHDSIHGSSVDEVHVEMQARYAGARQIAAGVIHDALKYIGKNLPAWAGKNEEILVMSPVTAKSQAVELWLPIGEPDVAGTFGIHTNNIAVQTEDGRLLDVQVLERPTVELNGRGEPRNPEFPYRGVEKVLFRDDFKAHEIRRYRIAEIDELPETTLCAGDGFIENEFIRVEVRNSLISLFDKRSGFAFHNLNLLEEDADAGDPWDYSPTWTPGEIVRSPQFAFKSRLKECGAVRAVLEITGEMNVPYKLEGDNRSAKRAVIPVKFEITVGRDSPRADVRLTFDNTAKDHRIRLRIPTAIRTGFVRSQGHLAIIDRPIERQKEIEKWYQPPTQLLPCREWVAVQDDRRGLAVALKGMYDYEAEVNPLDRTADLYITLLRGVELMTRCNTMQRSGDASYAVPTPGAQCLGEQVIEWSFIPYTADENEKAPFISEANGFLYPPVGHAVRAPHETERAAGFSAPYAVSGQNIQFSAFKVCYDGDGYILRLFENQGRETETEIELPPCFKSASLANMNERTLSELPIDGGKVRLHFMPYKALTLKLQCE